MNSNDDEIAGALHLCVLVHGLWGNPKHLDHIASQLREKHIEDELHILIATRNAGSFTYDGIETGAERVTQEIEEELTALEKSGKRVTKLSFVGYSLGGLVARYVIGILYSKGVLDKLKPMNFTTFATPHLGVRAPLLGWYSQLWNNYGGRTLSASGHQLFTIDEFRDTKRPLLSVLADPESVFIRALSTFKKRSLYANVINDRAVPFYSGYISRTDPFANIHDIDIKYEPGYEDVILDPQDPVSPKSQPLTLYESFSGHGNLFMKRLPFYIFIGLLAPVGSIVWLINSGFQSLQSANRIQKHETGKAGIGIGAYRIPLMMESVQRRTEEAFGRLSAAQGEEYLDSPNEIAESDDGANQNDAYDYSHSNGWSATGPSTSSPAAESPSAEAKTLPPQPAQAGFPTLALTPEQFAMVDSLDEVGFSKHAVFIHKVNHSHAAIIVRSHRFGMFIEGKTVSRHFVERFEI